MATCDLCFQTFAGGHAKKSVAAHFVAIHGPAKSQTPAALHCDSCSFETTSQRLAKAKEALWTHHRRRHLASAPALTPAARRDVKERVCDDCGLEQRGELSTFVTHLASAHGLGQVRDALVSCDECALRLTRSKVKRHWARWHARARPLPRPRTPPVEGRCEVCGWEGPREGLLRHLLRAHRLKVTGAPPPPPKAHCDDCDRALLKKHLPPHWRKEHRGDVSRSLFLSSLL